MIRSAARLWGYQDSQAESSFDPVVGLILGALSGELAQISSEINSVESRILEKLVDLLTPEPVTGPFPAHALMRARAAEPKVAIDPLYQFYLNKRFLIPGEHKADEKTVFFTPAGSYNLFSGAIKYMVSTSKIFEMQEEMHKEVIAVGNRGIGKTSTELWFGLQLDKAIESLKGLSFCFDLRNEAYEDSFYDSLTKGKWDVGGRRVSFAHGLQEVKAGKSKIEEIIELEPDATTKATRHIKSFYNNRFQTLTEPKLSVNSLLPGNELPKVFKEFFSSGDLESLEKDVLWFHVQFPQVLPNDVIDDLFCSINCFPVLNRHLIEFTQSAREYVNIIPLFTDEIYFDVRKITSSKGTSFTKKSFSGINKEESGSYIVRNGGVGRFDSRNAAEMISYLLELLRDESASFSIIGSDMITSELRELNQTITRLEHRLKESNVVRKDIPYLLLKAEADDDTLFVEFWTTNGEFGNRIKRGEKLFLYEGSGLWPESIAFITPTYGGREGMDTEERVNAYRKSLLSHGRVVTPEDIRSLCFQHFGKELKDVEVKKGVEIGKSTMNGYSRTLDVFITLVKPMDEYEPDELKFRKNDLLTRLKEQSVNILPFRCFYVSSEK